MRFMLRIAVIGALAISIFILLSVSPAVARDSVYSIQVKASRDAGEAAAEVKRLESTGFKAFSRHEDTGTKGMWYRIYVGVFQTETEAVVQANKFQAEGVITDFFIRRVPAPLGTPQAASGRLETTFEEEAGPGFSGQAESGKLNGFEIIVDLSGSISDTYRCNGYSKFEAIFSVLQKMNGSIPGNPYQAALRKFGYRKVLTRKDYTKLVWGVDTYERRAYSLGVNDLYPSVGTSPLGWAIQASGAELAVMDGSKALIIISDFKENHDFGDPMGKVDQLKNQYGENFRLYSINVGPDPEDIKLARQLAETSGGKYYDGCRLLSDREYFDGMIKEIFGVAVVVEEPVCPDADRDNVCDESDQCPGTPEGAPVDRRGCWIAAYSQFFDFDKAEVKREFLPRLEHAAKIIKENPGIKVTVAGHTDSDGPDKYNLKLGERRAKAVKEVLMEFGVSELQLEIVSYGESSPIVENDTDENKAKNRRVEFHVGELPITN